MAHVYQVEFDLDGELKQEPYEASNPGMAFAKCLKENPSATLIKAIRWGKIPAGPLSQYAQINYDPPKVQRPPRSEPKPVNPTKIPAPDEMVFPFFESCRRKESR